MPRRRGDRGRGRGGRIAETLGKHCPPLGTQAQTAGRGSEVRLAAPAGASRPVVRDPGGVPGKKRESGLGKARKEEGSWALQAGGESEGPGPG